uniref:Uncharacterized protein n=2 Tax=Meloidogyne enterolobii TaxID=390850 RepID=A0A6V7U2B5_MELEN|nr:unnamed protein product [Meloidogyne enterolobii]
MRNFIRCSNKSTTLMPKIKFLSLICLTASFCFLLYYIYSTNFNDELQILRTQFELKNQQILILKNEMAVL